MKVKVRVKISEQLEETKTGFLPIVNFFKSTWNKNSKYKRANATV